MTLDPKKISEYAEGEDPAEGDFFLVEKAATNTPVWETRGMVSSSFDRLHPTVGVYGYGGSTIAANTPTALSWTDAITPNAEMWDSGTPDEILLPKVGVYAVSFPYTAPGDWISGEYFSLSASLNGVTVGGNSRCDSVTGGGTYTFLVHCFSANQPLKIWYTHNGAGARQMPTIEIAWVTMLVIL